MATPLSKYIRRAKSPINKVLDPISGAVNKVADPLRQVSAAVSDPITDALSGGVVDPLTNVLSGGGIESNVSPVQQNPNEYNFLGQTEVELDRNILDKIGGFIGGISPALTGQGSAYRSIRAGEREGAVNALNRERMTALAKDARSVNNLLKAGDIEGATNILSSRVSAIGKLGGDASDTQGILDMITSGDIGAAVADLDLTVNRAIEGEYISPLSRKERDLAAKIKSGIVSLAPPQKDTALIQNLLAAGFEPGSPEMNAAIMENLNKTGTTINVGNKEEFTASQELGKLHVKRISNAIDAGDLAEGTLASVRQLRGVDVSQGGSVPLRAGLADAFASIGIDAEDLFQVDLANVQAFNSVNKRLINQVLNQAKGPQTEGDAKRAVRTLATLGNKPEANAFILDTLEANALRKIEQKNFLESSIDNGLTAKQANADWNKFKNTTPMLSTVSKVSKNGIPVYFFQFKEQAKVNRPNISDKEIVEAWRSANK